MRYDDPRPLSHGVNNQPTYRRGEYFRAELPLNNQPSAIYQGITNLAVLNNGTNADIISTNIGSAFLAKTPEVFSHDADGNLLVDGQWTNTWNGSPHEIALLPDTSRRCCSERLSPDTKQHLHLISRGRNRLITVETAAAAVSAGAPRQKVEWSYLSDGRWSQRVVSVWNGSAWVAQSTNRFVWDGVVLLAVLNGNNQVQQAYMRGSDLSGSTTGAGGVGGLLLTTDYGLLTTAFACFDGNGNVMALVDAADGTVSARYEYGPFGELIRATGPMAKANPFRFSSKYQDEETGLLYYGYRYLDVATGRWRSRDPIEEEGGINVYGYVRNEPGTRIDYLGQWHASVHQRRTTEWARLFFRDNYPAIIGDADVGVDSWIIPILLPGTSSLGPEQDRHMYYNRNGEDSRDVWYEREFREAERLLALANRQNSVSVCEEAAKAFGRGLHSRQDKSAHRTWPGGGDWSGGRMHPYWWDAWDETEYEGYGFSDVFWRRDVNQPPLYYPWARDDAGIQAQQRQLQIAKQLTVIDDTFVALTRFETAVAQSCVCRRAMFFHAW